MVNSRIFVVLISAFLVQGCDCHGTWSDNIRKMDQCLKDHKNDEQFCLKHKSEISSCRPILFEEKD